MSLQSIPSFSYDTYENPNVEKFSLCSKLILFLLLDEMNSLALKHFHAPESRIR